MVGRSAPRPAEVGILIGRIRSLVVKNMTIGIEAPLTTTPENGHRLAPIGRLTVQSKFPSPLGLILWIPVISSPIRTEPIIGVVSGLTVNHPLSSKIRLEGGSCENLPQNVLRAALSVVRVVGA